MLLGLVETGCELSVVALGEPYFVTSLRAAGVEGRVVQSTKEAEDAVELLAKEGRCKVVVVSEGLAVKLERKRDDLARRGEYYPVFAVVPGLGVESEGRTHRLYQLVSQAVGAKLKIGED